MIFLNSILIEKVSDLVFDSFIERTVYDYQYLVQPLGSIYKTTVDITIKIPFD